MNITDEIERQATLTPNSIAIYYENIEISFKQLNDYIWQVSNYLFENNIRENDVIANIFNDELTLFISMLATARIGATVFNIPANTPYLLLNNMLKEVNTKYIITDVKDIIKSTFEQKQINLINIINLKKEINKNIKSLNPKLYWLIISGSGSTGKSKYIPITHEQFIHCINHSISSLNISSKDKYLSFMHYNYSSPKERALATIYAGGSIIICKKDLENTFGLCELHNPTILESTVYHVKQSVKLNTNFINVRIFLLTASTVDDALRKEIYDKLCKNLWIRYGTNETGLISICNTEDALKTSNSVGKNIFPIQLQIVDENDKEKPLGEIGHIRVKSPGMINGYLNDEEATNKAFRNGWFYPGDLGKFTQDKELIYCGRSDLMMIMNGINIYPTQIENIITSHKFVNDASALPIKHPMHQDIPICAVVLKDNKQISKQELLNYCDERLGFSSPKEIIFLDFIPRNEQGKVIRTELSEMILKEIEKNKENKIQNNNLKQPTKEYKVEIIIPNNISINLINIWFKEALNLEEENISSNKHPIEKVSQKGLTLIQTLLEISQIPVFYKGIIKNIKLNDNKYSILLGIGYIDLIPNEFFLQVINFSFKYILWMGQNEPNIKNKLFFYKICQEEIINHIQKNMPSGKSRIPVLKTAYNKNIPFIHLGNGVYQLGWGSKNRKMDRSTIDTDSAMGSNLSQNKIFTANLLKMAGLPAPIHDVAQTKEEALEIVLKLKYPIVIKPIDLDRGEGVTVNIYDENKLFKAFELAFNLSKSKRVIVEKQVLGVCHRLFIANNKLLYCVKRLAISVQADGINNISTLIDNANNLESNKAPWIKKEFYPKDALTIEALKKVGFTLDSIPLKNTWIELRDIESTQWGGRDEDVTTIVHPDNLDIALRASKLFGLSVVGIDIITNDISKPWSESNAIINEVNFAPLLGGGEISKSCIPKFLDDFIEKDGRIPLEIFIGNTQETINIAKAKQEEYLNAGYKCYLTTHNTTLDNNLKQIILPTNSISNRTQALLLNNNVDALILLIQNDEFLHKHIPFDKTLKINIISGELKSINSNKNLTEIEFRNLIYNLSM